MRYNYFVFYAGLRKNLIFRKNADGHQGGLCFYSLGLAGDVIIAGPLAEGVVRPTLVRVVAVLPGHPRR